MTDIQIGLGLADWRWIGTQIEQIGGVSFALTSEWLASDFHRIGTGLASDWQWVEILLAMNWQRIGTGTAMDWPCLAID